MASAAWSVTSASASTWCPTKSELKATKQQQSPPQSLLPFMLPGRHPRHVMSLATLLTIPSGQLVAWHKATQVLRNLYVASLPPGELKAKLFFSWTTDRWSLQLGSSFRKTSRTQIASTKKQAHSRTRAKDKFGDEAKLKRSSTSVSWPRRTILQKISRQRLVGRSSKSA